MWKTGTVLLCLAFLCLSGCTGPQDMAEEGVAEAVEQLMKGISSADGALLEKWTADELVYGHSGGNVQNKDEFIAEIVSGKPLVYRTIQLSDQTVRIVDDVAIVRHVFTAETLQEGKPGTLVIGNMLVWQWKGGQWKLLARQAYKRKG